MKRAPLDILSCESYEAPSSPACSIIGEPDLIACDVSLFAVIEIQEPWKFEGYWARPRALYATSSTILDLERVIEAAGVFGALSQLLNDAKLVRTMSDHKLRPQL